MKKLNKKQERVLKALCRTLKTERRKAGHSLTDMNLLTDLSIATLSKLETSGNAVLSTLIKVADALNYDIILVKRENQKKKED